MKAAARLRVRKVLEWDRPNLAPRALRKRGFAVLGATETRLRFHRVAPKRVVVESTPPASLIGPVPLAKIPDMTSDDLTPIEPREAVSLYLDDRANEVSEQTLQAHEYRLERFLEWMESEYEESGLNPLTGRDLQRYKSWRSESVNNVTLKSQLTSLRVFLRFCESIDAVRDGLADTVQTPSLDHESRTRDAIIDADQASEILDYYSTFEYASSHHAVFRLIWETGMRMGAAQAIDLDDVHLEAEYVEINHRPGSTPLKNGSRGERDVAITSRTAEILEDYIDVNRHEVTDEHGRRPLFSTAQGRMTDATMRERVYNMTRPCAYNGGDCPHGRDLDECEAREGRGSRSKCPDSEAPHAVRRGAITHFLSSDAPAKVVSDRMDVSQDVISEHYDSRSERDKMEQRRDFLSNV